MSVKKNIHNFFFFFRGMEHKLKVTPVTCCEFFLKRATLHKVRNVLCDDDPSFAQYAKLVDPYVNGRTLRDEYDACCFPKLWYELTSDADLLDYFVELTKTRPDEVLSLDLVIDAAFSTGQVNFIPPDAIIRKESIAEAAMSQEMDILEMYATPEAAPMCIAWACHRDRRNVITMLLEKFPNAGPLDHAFALAAHAWNVDLMRLLYDTKRVKHGRDVYGIHPHNIAVSRKAYSEQDALKQQSAIACIVETVGIDTTIDNTFMHACKYESPGMVESLLAKGQYSTLEEDEWGISCLEYASRRDDSFDIISVLLRRQCSEEHLRRAAVWACRRDNVPSFKLIFSTSTSILNAKDPYNNGLLGIACFYECRGMIEFLIQGCGLEPTVDDYARCMKNDSIETFEMLLPLKRKK